MGGDSQAAGERGGRSEQRKEKPKEHGLCGQLVLLSARTRGGGICPLLPHGGGPPQGSSLPYRGRKQKGTEWKHEGGLSSLPEMFVSTKTEIREM